MQSRHRTTRQDLLNSIAIVLAAREDPSKALDYLEKAEAVYGEKDHDIPELSDEIVGQHDLLKGLVCKEEMEKHLTQTYFYLAQVYSKTGEVAKGINYCGRTMQRQVANNTYESKDFVLNCITLSDYFQSQSQFAQAEYVLNAASAVLPED